MEINEESQTLKSSGEGSLKKTPSAETGQNADCINDGLGDLSGSVLPQIRLPGTPQSHSSIRHFALETTLDQHLTAALIDITTQPELIADALKLCAASFPNDPLAPTNMNHTYEDIRRGEVVQAMTDPTYSDYGREIEWTGFFVYSKEGQVAGIAGLYRYLDEPRVFWLGRFAVGDEFRGTGLARDIVDHIVGCAEILGGECLKAYTEDASGNARAQRFYEKYGFELTDETFVDRGVVERVYQVRII